MPSNISFRRKPVSTFGWCTKKDSQEANQESSVKHPSRPQESKKKKQMKTRKEEKEIGSGFQLPKLSRISNIAI